METSQTKIYFMEENQIVYEKPVIEIIEMVTEGILCSSGEDFTPGGGWND